MRERTHRDAIDAAAGHPGERFTRDSARSLELERPFAIRREAPQLTARLQLRVALGLQQGARHRVRGVEVGDAQLIGIQKELISRARSMDRVVITATQMMESMISNSMPTRAEVFDVANAVLDGTDAVMLSAETAVGSYPVEVVAAMSDSALGAERQPVSRTSRFQVSTKFSTTQEAIARSAMYAANNFSNVRGIACLTESGSTPLLMSRVSSGLPIFALSRHGETLQRLCVCRGIVPLYFDAGAFDQDRVEARAIEFLLDRGYLGKGDSILLTKGTVLGTAGSTNIMKSLPVY